MSPPASAPLSLPSGVVPAPAPPIAPSVAPSVTVIAPSVAVDVDEPEAVAADLQALGLAGRGTHDWPERVEGHTTA